MTFDELQNLRECFKTMKKIHFLGLTDGALMQLPQDGYYAFVVVNRNQIWFKEKSLLGDAVFLKPMECSYDSDPCFESHHRTIPFFLTLKRGEQSDNVHYRGESSLKAGQHRAGECIFRNGEIVYLSDQCGGLREDNALLKELHDDFINVGVRANNVTLVESKYNEQSCVKELLYRCFSEDVFSRIQDKELMELKSLYASLSLTYSKQVDTSTMRDMRNQNRHWSKLFNCCIPIFCNTNVLEDDNVSHQNMSSVS